LPASIAKQGPSTDFILTAGTGKASEASRIYPQKALTHHRVQSRCIKAKSWLAGLPAAQSQKMLHHSRSGNKIFEAFIMSQTEYILMP
jgi:hypothetical protein